MSEQTNTEPTQPPEPSAIETMQALTQWVCWREEMRDGKPVKVPKNPRTGGNASSTNPKTWNTYDYVTQRQHEYNGIGFMFKEGGGIVGVDVDKCVEDGRLNDKAKEIVEALDSYTEYSPSGKGIHILARGEIARNFNNQAEDVEMYDKTRYFTVTGKHVADTPLTLNHRQGGIDAVHAKYATPPPGEKIDAQPHISAGEANRWGDPLDKIRKGDDKLDRLLNNDSSGYPSPSEADMATAQKLYFYAYEDADIMGILRAYRPRDKMKRLDYLQTTVGNIRRGEQITHPLREKIEDILPNLKNAPKTEPHAEAFGHIPYESAEALYDDLHQYFKDHLDLMRDTHYHILTAWVFATWNIAKLKTIAYLMFRGLKASGKSRALDTLELVCHNSENCAVITRAAMNRVLGLKTSTFFIDEFDKLSEQKIQDLLPVLNSGYTRRKYAVICDKEDPNKIIRLPCFGPKALALINGTDDAFTSRCIYIPMSKNVKDINYEIDEDKAKDLKGKLAKWQYDHTPDPPTSTKDLYLGDDVQPQDKIRNYRIVQLFEPLTTSIPPTKRAKLLEYARELDKEDVNEELDELYLDIYTIIKTKYGDSEKSMMLLLKDIREVYNEGKTEDSEDYLSPKASGRHMNTMGFTQSKRTKGGIARIIKKDVLERIGKRFERGPQTLKNK